MPQQTVSGVHSIKSGSHTILGMNIGMSIGMLYAFWADFNNLGKFISYLFLGLLVGFCIGSFIRRKISNASIEFLEEMKPETDQIKNYLMETIHIDHSDPAIIEKTKEVIAPIDEALQKNYSEYLDGISLFQEQYAQMVMMTEKELANLRKEWEKEHADIMPKTKKECEKYWEHVETGFQQWQKDAAKAVFTFVRDEISHSFDIGADVVTVKASEVLKEKTGICHAKANLLAAMLRSIGIPCGICFEYLHFSRRENAYCLHAFNAIYLDMEWIFVDARGNKDGVDAQFEAEGEPKLAFLPDEKRGEYFVNGIFVAPHEETMQCLEESNTIEEVMDTLPYGDGSLVERMQPHYEEV